MKYKILLVALLFCVISFSQNYNTHSYGEHPQQVYDIYFPDEVNEDTKVVLFLHGGSWWATHRQRSYYRSFVEDLFEQGNNIVVNADYRLLVEGTETYVFPDQINDVESIINHVQENYNLHNNSIVLTGNSAGGHLALWYYLNDITPVEKVVFITAPYDGNAPYGSRIYFDARLPFWIRQQFVNPNMGIEDVITYASPKTYANPEKNNIFSVWAERDHEVPYSQRDIMLEDYPNMRNVTYNTSHSGWLNRAFRYDLIENIIDFVGEESEEECTTPTNVTLTRISHTKAKFEGANPNFNYQGSANRAGRPLRPYPMYGMDNMTVPHIQDRLVPAFDYDVWLRTICGDGTYSDWSEAFYLPRFEGAKTGGNYYNINGVFMGNDYEQLPRGYYIKTNGQQSIKIYKK